MGKIQKGLLFILIYFTFREMKQLIIALTVCISIAGCTPKKKETNPYFKKINIPFAEAQIDIPKEFELISADDFILKIKSLELDNNNSKLEIARLERIKSYPLPSLIYLDSTNIDNRIYFQKMEHILLDKTLSQFYVGKLEQQLESNWVTEGIDFVRLESKFSKGKTTQLIKIRYRLQQNGIDSYSSQYIITTQKQTMIITFYSVDPYDFGNVISKLMIK